MLLKNLIKNSSKKYKNLNIRGLALNSKDIGNNFIFFAIKGNKFNGENYIKEAIKKGAKVLIIEDVITTGKSSLECSKLVADSEGIIIGYACIINRSNGKSKINSKIVSQVELNIPTFTEKNLPKELSSIEPVKPGSRNL